MLDPSVTVEPWDLATYKRNYERAIEIATELRAERDHLLTFVWQKCNQCGAVTAPDLDLLAKIRDSRYSNEWVGIAIRARFADA